MIAVAAVILSGFPLGYASHKLFNPATEHISPGWRGLARRAIGSALAWCLLALTALVGRGLCDWQMLLSLAFIYASLGLGVALGYWHTSGKLRL